MGDSITRVGQRSEKKRERKTSNSKILGIKKRKGKKNGKSGRIKIIINIKGERARGR